MSFFTRLVRIARPGCARLRVPVAALVLAACQSLSPQPTWAGPVNINAADAATLSSELKGIGPVKAQRLVEYRQKHGPFRTLDDLALVKGFGQKLIERNRADLRLGNGTPAAAAVAPRPAGTGTGSATVPRAAAAKVAH
jgi:competence protein ComEA